TILTIGTEILFGSILNTNSVFLSKELNALGIDVLRHVTVGDNRGRLLKALQQSYEDCNLIITTGGLGPTEDDLTKETIAEYFGAPLEEHPEELKTLRSWFESQGRVMAENNVKQAWFPRGSVILPNPNGTAPGFYYTDGKRHIYVLPGPPRENVPMFRDHVAPRLSAHDDGYLFYKIVRTTGIGESDLETRLMDLIDGQTDPTIATYAKLFECSFRVASKRPTLKEAQDAVEKCMVKIRERVGEYIYSEDDKDLLVIVMDKLKEKGIKIASAESITGGMFAKMITDVPGASKVFSKGIVTYSNDAKMSELGVSSQTLDKYGAISPQTAEEMVRGLCKKSGCRICVSVTGNAGPDADEGKPVGQFFVGLMNGDEVTVKEFRANRNNRNYIREFACYQMVKMVHNVLRNID
ncbi:MAG: competence/damage-inducible protein A, partial [Firmicutes bacterium]|nr:competence/damage-inducible protein A [Bacillota bacterium]